MSKEEKLKVIVMCGLPGSGKSRLAKQLDEKYSNPKGWGFRRIYDSMLVDMDNHFKHFKQHGASNGWGGKTNEDCMSYCLRRAFENVNNRNLKYLILDGLFTTQKQYEDIAVYVDGYDADLELHFFEEDRDTCLWNDRGRENGRYSYNDEKSNCAATIKNAPLMRPDVVALGKIMGKEVELITHYVEKKSGFDLWCHEVIDKIHVSDNGKVKSESWSMGGTWGNCWDDHLHTQPGEPAPTSFKNLDDIMIEVCPNITFLQGRKIYNDCVKTDTYGESDYYGGSVDYAYYECDLKKLYDLLCEWGYIDGDYLK